MDAAHLTPSQEDYLEAVYRISEEKKPPGPRTSPTG